MVRYFQIVFCLLLLICLTDLGGLAMATQPNTTLLKKLQQITAVPEQYRKANFAGRERALICGYCHGNDGNSIRAGVPNLAGQNPDYLLQQVGRFARGERKDFVMNSLARKFTDQDQINLAIFYAGQEVKAARYSPSRTAKGKKLYWQQCRSCHGDMGRGNVGYARLAGQKLAYIEMTLRRFRGNSTSMVKPEKRRSPIMESVTRGLTNRQIHDLAAYIASM